jgi:HTH-type transcriptional repressor of NAD biosynthesis genes
MYNVGVIPGKFLPPHRGHLFQIINAATKCKKLYVVVSDNREISRIKCQEAGLKEITLELRALWLSLEFQNIDNIEVLILDEADIPEYPQGCEAWSQAIFKLLPRFDVFFGGEKEYMETYMRFFPSHAYKVFDYKRSRYSISGTVIRNDPLGNWDYILGSARGFFAKRVLITGTESCGKTTMTKYLAKIYHTSWTEEYGRHYSKLHLGGNESLFSFEDFEKIAIKQHELDNLALKGANKIVFFDTDAVVTQYYCHLYLNKYNKNIERYVDPSKYDKVFILTPNVEWVGDGLRFKNQQSERERLHNKLFTMYKERGFNKITLIEEEDYSSRLEFIINCCDNL